MEFFLTYIVMPFCLLGAIISAKLFWRSPFSRKEIVKEITLKDLNEQSLRNVGASQNVVLVSSSSSGKKSSFKSTNFGLDDSSNNYLGTSSGFNSCDSGSCGE